MTTLVRHAMTEAPKTLKSSMTVRDAAGLMASHDIGAVPVADEDGSLIGLVTDRDLVTARSRRSRIPARFVLRTSSRAPS